MNEGRKPTSLIHLTTDSFNVVKLRRIHKMNIQIYRWLNCKRRRIDAFELWCWRRLLRVPWTARRSNQSILKEISPGCSLERLMLRLKPQVWPPDWKSWLIGKDPDAGKDWGQEGKGKTEDEMVGWHHRLNGHGFGWTPGVGDGHEGLACWGSCSRKELDTGERLNWLTETWSSRRCQEWTSTF